MSLTDLRENYTKGTLTRDDLSEDPLHFFDGWLNQVIESKVPDANAMTLATVDDSGVPSQRIVLLKGRPDDKFVFYTNYDSYKAHDIDSNSNVSLHFPWHFLERQVMVVGVAERLSDKENDEYFAIRPKDSQVGAVASLQSQPLSSRQSLVDKFLKMKQDFADTDVPRPNWGGYAVSPRIIEFWQGGEHRLHDRFRYTRQSADAEWHVQRLNP